MVAKRFPSGDAELAVPACRVQPGNADAVAFLDMLDAGADRGHVTHPFVAGDEGQGRLDRPVAIGGMQVGVADARGNHLDQHLPGRHFRHGHFLDLQRLSKLEDDGGFHQ